MQGILVGKFKLNNGNTYADLYKNDSDSYMLQLDGRLISVSGMEDAKSRLTEFGFTISESVFSGDGLNILD